MRRTLTKTERLIAIDYLRTNQDLRGASRVSVAGTLTQALKFEVTVGNLKALYKAVGWTGNRMNTRRALKQKRSLVQLGVDNQLTDQQILEEDAKALKKAKSTRKCLLDLARFVKGRCSFGWQEQQVEDIIDEILEGEL